MQLKLQSGRVSYRHMPNRLVARSNIPAKNNITVIRGFTCAALILCAALLNPRAASAFTIELDDVAPLRIEWQRKFARGEQPFPGAPSIDTLPQRLAERGFKLGTPMFVRMFKAESEMEIWLLRGQKYELFETYPICHWSGSLGPKLAEGDKQNPEGFYSVGWRQLRRVGKWPKSINIGFPNRFDRANGRTGSYILLHGGCSSVGCFAMTNPAMNEIQALSAKAIHKGQKRFQLHIYPFRMTTKNIAPYENHKWFSFWQNLKQAYDVFERTKVPPRINVCGKNYYIQDAGTEDLLVQKPMRKLRMVKLGEERRSRDKDEDICYQQPKVNHSVGMTSAVKGLLHQSSTTTHGARF